MKEYRFALDGDAYYFLSRLKKTEREALLRLFQDLERDPFAEPLFVHHQISPRNLSVIKCRKWLVFYWVDHAAREVRIVEIRAAT